MAIKRRRTTQRRKTGTTARKRRTTKSNTFTKFINKAKRAEKQAVKKVGLLTRKLMAKSKTIMKTRKDLAKKHAATLRKLRKEHAMELKKLRKALAAANKRAQSGVKTRRKTKGRKKTSTTGQTRTIRGRKGTSRKVVSLRRHRMKMRQMRKAA